jgi:membrane peptidoglycan carboxypeptidase
LKVNRNLGERWTARKEAKARRKVERMRGLPKSRLKRIIWRLNPRRQAEYWFSHDGGIMALKIIGVGVLVLFVVSVSVFAYFRKDLPDVTDISGGNLGGSISYYDRTGKTLLWQDYNGVKRVPVSGNAISNYMKEATVATEDRNFYSERGFDLKGILRAAYVDVFHRGSTQGGSTITEQLVKLTQDFGQKRNLSLKAKELILAVELERTYTKDQILTGYLNAAPYGSVDYGVQSAAADYFHKSAKDLTLPEAAMLAAIPQSPAYYSPYDASTFDKAAFAVRYDYVLDSMRATGKITKAQATAAKKYDILAEVQTQQSLYAGIQAPYFVLAAKDQLTTEFAPSGSSASSKKVGGWKVITTLDTNLQAESEKLVASNLSYVERYNADEEAQVGEDVQTGQIVSLVGGVDFTNPQYGQNNYAAGILIPPGSSFKPYDYSTLINDNNNVGAGSVLYDTQGPLPGYPCTNNSSQSHGGNCLQDYDFLQPGPETLRYALGGSRNIPAVKTMLESQPGDTSTNRIPSINNVIKTATAMMDNTYDNEHNLNSYNCYSDIALTQPTQCYGASAIGDGAYLTLDDHVNGLSTLARLGQAIPRTFILKITDSGNKTIYQWKQPKPTQPIKPDTAYILDNMLSDPNASYLPGSCSATTCTPLSRSGYKFQRYNGWDFAVKTGTTNNGLDGLMTSWSTKYAVVSWVGNHTRNIALGIDMEYLTEPLTRGWMEYAHQNLKPVNWTQPSDIKTLPAFVVRNHIHYGDIEPSPSTDLFPSWYIGNTSGSTTSATIDKVSGKLATNCTPALAKQTQNNANVASWNVDIFHGGMPNVGGSSSSSGSGGYDDVHSCSDSPPTVDSFFVQDNSGGNPEDVTNGGTASCTGSCTITTTVSAGTHPFNDTNYPQYPGTVNLLVNGQVAQSAQVSDSPSTVSFQYTSAGTATLAIQVIDSVLYSGQSGNATVTIVAQAAGPTNFTANVSGTSTVFTWSGGTAPYTVSKGGTPLCTTSGPTCSVLSAQAPSGTNVTVQDNNGYTAIATVN